MTAIVAQLLPFMFVAFGLIIGSFLTVCIFRLPFASLAEEQKVMEEMKDGTPQSDIKYFDDLGSPLPKVHVEKLTLSDPPRSFCASCFNTLKWWHNIPLFSWLFLGGKCSYCKAPISVRYPLVEVITAILALLSFATFGITPTACVVFAFSCALIVITVIDYDYYIIPNAISLPGIAIGICIAAINHFYPVFQAPVVGSLKECFFGMISGAGFLYLVSEFYLRVRKIEGLGMGDVKLLAMTGALFGPECSIYTIFLGSILGALIGGLLILVKGKNMSHPLPFGPYLAAATLIYIFGGPNIMMDTSQVFVGAFR